MDRRTTTTQIGASVADLLQTPRVLADLPWSAADKRALEEVLLAACVTAGQDTIILAGAPGSGRSTLLQEVIPTAYMDVMLRNVPDARATGVPRQFRERCVLSLYTQKMDAARFRNQLSSFPYLQVGRPWHRLVLCDDVDGMLETERAALVDLVDAPAPAARMRIFLTCASLERVPAPLVRRAMIFRLPDLRLRANRLRVVELVGTALAGRRGAAGAAFSSSFLATATGRWLESGDHLADLWNDVDMHLLAETETENEQAASSSSSSSSSAARSAWPAAGPSSAVNDYLVGIWRGLCLRFPGHLPWSATRAGLAIAERLAFVPESRSAAVAREDPALRRLEGDLREIERGQVE